MTRLVHVGLGPLGVRALGDFLRRGMGEVVSAVDPAHAGADLSALVPGAPAGIVITGDLDEALGASPDLALVTSLSDLAACAPTLHALAAAGVDTVSSCEELSFPRLRHAALADELDAALVGSGSRLLGTGVNPGFLMDALPLFVTGLCNGIERLEVGRIQDATTRRLPFQKKIGATLDRAGFDREVAAGRLRHVGLGESLHLLAAGLGLRIDGWDESIEPVLAEVDLECGLGPIPAGHCAGVRQVARAVSGGRERLVLEFQAAIAQPEPRDYVRITGEPSFELLIPGAVHGDVATSAVLLNCIAPLRDARPGLRTMADLRPPGSTFTG